MIVEMLRKTIEDALKGLKLSVVSFSVEHPDDFSHGDYTTNVALVAAKEVKKNPHALAEEIARYIEEHKTGEVERIGVAGPGFINVSLTPDYFATQVSEAITDPDSWGHNDAWKGKKVIVEYTDPNPFKELHVGHLVPNAIGESLSRLFMVSGAEVKRVTFQGDVGLHVAKAIWGMRKMQSVETPADLGRAYVEGARAYETDDSAKREIKELNKIIYDKSDALINELYEKGKSISLAYFETGYKALGSEFDHYFFESEVGPRGLATVRARIGDVFDESEGAVVFKGERHGLHTRVFITSEKIPTYEAKDIGLAEAKREYFPFDLSLTVTDNQQKEYFRVVQSALRELYPDWASTIALVTNGTLRLTEGKMSSRTGNVISAPSFIDKVKQSVLEKTKESGASDDDALSIAVAAIKYSILKQATGKDILFDKGKALSFEGDSGPYLQYAHTRAVSVLSKAGKESITEAHMPEGWKTTDVERLLPRFPEVVLRAVSEYEPHYVTTYLIELAGSFNSWYAKEKILDGTEAQAYKLALTKSVATTLKNGLWILGIKMPNKM